MCVWVCVCVCVREREKVCECVCVCGGGGGGGGYDVLKCPFQEEVRDKAQLIAKQLGLAADTSHQVNTNLIV